MARINFFNTDYNAFSNTRTSDNYSGINLSDFASIRNGSYGKVLKAYYAKQNTSKSIASKEESAKFTLAKSNADELKKSAHALTQISLWEKKTFTEKDSVTDEESKREDYDWENIHKSVKAFVSDYNDVVDDASNSNSKTVLRNGVWMTNMTSQNSGLLKEVGISIGKGNKLEVDEKALKEANISTLKTLFTGHHSYANKVSQKSVAISMATVNKAVKSNVSYTENGAYAKSLSDLLPSSIDEEI